MGIDHAFGFGPVSALETKYKRVRERKLEIIKNQDYDKAEAIKRESSKIALELKKERTKIQFQTPKV